MCSSDLPIQIEVCVILVLVGNLASDSGILHLRLHVSTKSIFGLVKAYRTCVMVNWNVCDVVGGQMPCFLFDDVTW